MNNFQEKVDLLIAIFPDYLCIPAKNELIVFCPQCNHHIKKLIINLDKELFHCWVCDYSGHISKLLRTYGNEEIWRNWQHLDGKIDFDFDLRSMLSDKQTIATKKRVVLPPESRKLTNDIPSLIAKNAISFLNSRGISYQTIRMYNMYYAEEGRFRDRIIIPSYDTSGRINFFVARSFYNVPDIIRYIHADVLKEDIIFNELFVTWEKPIILVEGLFDAIAINQNSIPLLGSHLREKSAIFKKILNFHPEVILMLDNDLPGRDGTLKAAKLLTTWGIETFTVDYKGKDPGESDRQYLKSIIKQKKRISQSDILKGHISGI